MRPGPFPFRRRAWLAAIAVLGFVACAKPEPAPAPIEPGEKLSVHEYFPLTERSRWTYRIQELRKGFDYVNRVRVFGEKHFEPLDRDVIQVEESYSSTGSGVFLLEEQEPVVYFLENGFLNRMFLTRQAGELIAASGSGDSRFLPEILTAGEGWDSSSQAFRVGNLGFKVAHSHRVEVEPEPVEVPAGTFRNCIRIDTFSSHGPGSGSGPDDDLVFFYSDWYAPGVGLVKTQQWDDKARTKERTRIELLDYSVEPAAAAAEKTAGALSVRR